MSSHVRQATGDSFHSDVTIAAHIPALLFRSGPHTIPRLVIPIVILSIQAHAFEGSAHIAQEILKDHPPFAHFNAPAAITGPSGVIRIEASLLHCRPHLVNIRFNTPARVSVFDSGAAARCDLFGSQVRSNLTNDFAAFTLTFPDQFCLTARPRLLSGQSDNFQPSKSFSDQGYSRRHNDGSNIVVFSSECPATTGTRCDYSKTLNQVN